MIHAERTARPENLADDFRCWLKSRLTSAARPPRGLHRRGPGGPRFSSLASHDKSSDIEEKTSTLLSLSLSLSLSSFSSRKTMNAPSVPRSLIMPYPRRNGISRSRNCAMASNSARPFNPARLNTRSEETRARAPTVALLTSH